MNRRTHLMVDRVFKDVGRIHRSMETADPREAKKRERMLFTLHDHSRIDILRGIRDGRLSVTQVSDAFARNRLDDLPTAEALVPLQHAVEIWLQSGHGSRKPLRGATLAGYRQMWQQALADGAFGTEPSVADVTAERTEAYRRKLLQAGHAPMANRCWCAVKSFLGETLGKRHSQVLAVQDLQRYPELKRVRPALTPENFWRWHGASSDVIRPALVAMAVSGMMPSELERLGPEHVDRANGWLLVPGAKTEGRPRIVGVPSWAWEAISQVTPWRLDRSCFQRQIKKSARNAGVPWARLYDLRRGFARWHEASGTPESRIRAYMGHSTLGMTDSYLRSEVEPYAQKDAERMGEHLRGGQNRHHLQLAG
ncbi:MAG: hypothetical protein ABSD56_05785 [Bryobacteraceae bacterium]